jgi:tetratricopeptide (TPR) repeat protein
LSLKFSLLLAVAVAVAAGMDSGDVTRARDFSYRQQYDSALAITSAVIARDSSDPSGFYWQASIIQLLIYDSGRGWLADSFFVLSDRAVALCRQRLAQDPEDAQAHFYFGMTQLNRASFLGWQQRILPAFKVLFDVAPHLNAALARDSSLTDARLGLGMIDYFKAVSNRYTLGLRLLGSRAKAYAAIRPVADGEGLLKPAAQTMIAYMLKEDGDYEAALVYCRRLRAEYPGNRSALRLTRDALFKSGQYAAAIQVGAELDSTLPRVFPDDKYAIAENWDVCGKAYAQMGKKEEARERFNRVIAWEQYQDCVPWLPRYVREAKQWLSRLDRQ